MLPLVGIFLVFAAVLGGFLLERGNPWVLMQPAELLIIGGSACGITLVANPPRVILKIAHGIKTLFQPPPHTRASFLRNLCMLYEVFSFVRRGGLTLFERDIEDPAASRIFSRYPEFLRDDTTRSFLCDSLRMLVIGATTPHDLDCLMDLDIEVQRRGRHEPVGALTTIADALPGLGIVAAVLGVVITMGSIGESPESVGQKVAAALVGTFLGILLCYGVVGPAAARLEVSSEQETQFLHVIRNAVMSFARGASPILALESARRSIPADMRPSFVEMETTLRRDAKIPPVQKPGAPEENAAQATAS
jgi:chemotaxis protein MotA